MKCLDKVTKDIITYIFVAIYIVEVITLIAIWIFVCKTTSSSLIAGYATIMLVVIGFVFAKLTMSVKCSFLCDTQVGKHAYTLSNISYKKVKQKDSSEQDCSLFSKEMDSLF